VENVYIILHQIYSGNGVPSFIKIAQFIGDITKNILVSFCWIQCTLLLHCYTEKSLFNIISLKLSWIATLVVPQKVHLWH